MLQILHHTTGHQEQLATRGNDTFQGRDGVLADPTILGKRSIIITCKREIMLFHFFSRRAEQPARADNEV